LEGCPGRAGRTLLKAVLLPFATLGGSSVLDAMRLANL